MTPTVHGGRCNGPEALANSPMSSTSGIRGARPIQSADKHNDLCKTIGAAIYPQDISTPSYIEAESTRFFALRELHRVGRCRTFDRNFSTDVAVSSGFFHISLPRTSVCSAIRRPPYQYRISRPNAGIFVSQAKRGIERPAYHQRAEEDNPRPLHVFAPAISATLPSTSSRSPLMTQPIDWRAASHSSHPASGELRERSTDLGPVDRGCRHNVAGADQPSKGMTDWTFASEGSSPRPPVRQAKRSQQWSFSEIIDAYQLAILKNGCSVSAPHRNLCHQLGRMQRRVGIVSHAGKIPAHRVHGHGRPGCRQ